MNRMKTYIKPEIIFLSKAKLDNIEARMSGGGGTTFEGGESRPYILVSGLTKTVCASNYWFQYTAAGAVAFSFVLSVQAEITIYKKNIFGRNQIAFFTISENITHTISDCQINNGENTYLIREKPCSKVYFSISAAQHIDERNNSNGALWKPFSESAISNPNILYFKYWYVNSQYVSKIVDMVTHADFLTLQSGVVNGTLSLSMFLIGLEFPVTSLLLGIASVVTAFIGPFDFKKSVIDDIDNAAGKEENIDGQSNYRHGCLIKEYVSNGITFHEIVRWDGSYMSGPKGWTGFWENNL